MTSEKTVYYERRTKLIHVLWVSRSSGNLRTPERARFALAIAVYATECFRSQEDYGPIFG
jgi:hypothetical protein